MDKLYTYEIFFKHFIRKKWACPICGSKDIELWHLIDPEENEPGAWHIQCGKCEAATDNYYLKKSLIPAWKNFCEKYKHSKE